MHTYFIKKGTTNVSIELEIIDSTAGTPETGVVWNTAGIALEYRRDGAVSTAITEATLAALTTAHTDGGFLHIGNGVYRFDLPDLACASGVDKVVVHGTVTGMIVIPVCIQLTDIDIFDAVRGGMTSLPASGTLAVNPTLASVTHTGAVIPTVSTLTGHTAQTGDTYALANGATGFVAIDTVVDAIKAVTDDWIDGARLDLILDIIAADTTTDIPALIATAQADLDIITDTDGVILGAAGVDLIWDEPYAAHLTAATMGLSEVLGSVALIDTTLAGTPTTTTFQLTAGSTIDDFYNDQSVYILSGTGAGQVRVILDYTGATKTVTVDEPWVTTPAAADRVAVLVGHVHPITQITADMDANSTQLAAIVADTNELQTNQGNWLTATGFATETKQDAQDLIITEARLAELDAANIPADVDNLNLGIIYGAAATGTLSTTQATSDLTGYADDQLIGRVIIWTSGAADGEGTVISDYASASGLLTFTALTTAPGNTDTFKIV